MLQVVIGCQERRWRTAQEREKNDGLSYAEWKRGQTCARTRGTARHRGHGRKSPKVREEDVASWLPPR